ncbi:mycofactocin biosynthesis glycosyltransferase MftF [Streptomyces sp. NPDC004647]|uniref:mycofactocin biosynthesis glycosyltransferase MftF n=1 Tax=Streptomyces sp. NPDC004647 TaxID=3154671 RepID=UPI0033A28F52
MTSENGHGRDGAADGATAPGHPSRRRTADDVGPSGRPGPRLIADVHNRVLAGGRVLLGGSPYRVLRLSREGARLVAGWLAGEPVSASPHHRRLASRLVRAGFAHPRYATGSFTRRDVTAVVPVRDHAAAVRRLLPRLDELSATIVVDDGSLRPLPEATVRHGRPRGPAAARNTGWTAATTPLIAFLDADVEPDSDWLEPLLRHFEDPDVLAVAPRVRSTPGRTLLERYESVRSSLDMGTTAGPVRPGSRVSYVPSAALVVRTSALRALGGFDERMRFGEDVDLVWRLAATGGQVRYEPTATVRHTPRSRWRDWAGQRFDYGTSAAPLALRHGGAVAPVKVSVWSALAWTALAAAHPRSALLIAGSTAALLPRKLQAVGVPATEALRLASLGHWGAGRALADAATRTWWPVTLPLLAAGRTSRLLLAAAYGRHVADWLRMRPPLDLPRWVAARAMDDFAYGAGVWWGALRERTVAPFLPDLTDWPGKDGILRCQDGPTT